MKYVAFFNGLHQGVAIMGFFLNGLHQGAVLLGFFLSIDAVMWGYAVLIVLAHRKLL